MKVRSGEFASVSTAYKYSVDNAMKTDTRVK